MAVVWPHVSAYTKYDVQLIKVPPEDGLIESETCGASNRKIKSNHKNFVHLVGSYAYCRMMHGAYSVKLLCLFLSIYLLSINNAHSVLSIKIIKLRPELRETEVQNFSLW